MEKREAMTIRFPGDVLEGARQAKSDRESLNDFVVDAVQREVRRRRGFQAYQQILHLREVIETSAGPQPDSTNLIRGLRDDVTRRD